MTITAGVNDQLNIIVDGVAASVTLAAGTYASADALAAEVQSKLNGAASLMGAGNSVAVSQSGGVLSITSARYGSASSVTITGGNGAADLMGASPVVDGRSGCGRHHQWRSRHRNGPDAHGCYGGARKVCA